MFLIFWEMIPSSRKLEKNSLIFRKKICYYISGGNFPSSKKRKKHTQKKFLVFFQKIFFLYFREWNFLAPNLKSSNIFSKNKFLLYFRSELAKLEKQKRSTLKKFLIFSKKEVFPSLTDDQTI